MTENIAFTLLFSFLQVRKENIIKFTNPCPNQVKKIKAVLQEIYDLNIFKNR